MSPSPPSSMHTLGASLCFKDVFCLYFICIVFYLVFLGGSDDKESACNAGDLGLIPGSGRSPGEGNGYPLQYSCLENPHGQRSLAGGLQWGCKELDILNHFHFAVSHILHNYYCERGRIFHPVNVLSYTSLFSLFLLLNM